MKLIQCRFSSGKRVPILVRSEASEPLPILVPFIEITNLGVSLPGHVCWPLAFLV